MHYTTPTQALSPLGFAAAKYALRGWPVLPLEPRTKLPQALIAPNGYYDATTDLKRVANWWQYEPGANIGIRVGASFAVLDIDGPEGLENLAPYVPQGYAHTGPISRTGRDEEGYHYLFEVVPGGARKPKILPKVDWLPADGYIVAPPSIHPDTGKPYRWLRGPEQPLPPVPDWLADLVAQAAPGPAPQPYHALLGAHTTPGAWHRDLVGAFEQHFPGIVFQPRGRLLQTSCVFHEGDNDPSLKVFPDQSFYCFGCEAFGDAGNLDTYARTGRIPHRVDR